MKLEKTIVDGDLWYIDNFLTEEEIDLFKPYMYDKNEWYVTMRSPYKNVLNKYNEVEKHKQFFSRHTLSLFCCPCFQFAQKFQNYW